MNDAPTPPPQPTPTVAPEPPAQPEPSVSEVIHPTGSQAFSNWSLILGIGSLVLSVIFFVSIPAAIVAVVFGSMVLVKRLPGKNKAIAGIITGGVFLLVALPLIAITIVAYNGVTQKANEAQKLSMQREADKKAALATNKVDTTCYSYPVPKDYEYDTASKDCTSAVNIPNGDALTRITVRGNTGTIGSIQDVVALLNKTIKQSDPNSPGVVDQESLTINGRTVYYVSYKDSHGLLYGNYIFPDNSASRTDKSGETIVGYKVAGYTYNSGLKAKVRGVADSLTIK